MDGYENNSTFSNIAFFKTESNLTVVYVRGPTIKHELKQRKSYGN